MMRDGANSAGEPSEGAKGGLFQPPQQQAFAVTDTRAAGAVTTGEAMSCENCGGRWWIRDPEGDLVCVPCGRPREKREHEEPKKEARIDIGHYKRRMQREIGETHGMEMQ